MMIRFIIWGVLFLTFSNVNAQCYFYNHYKYDIYDSESNEGANSIMQSHNKFYISGGVKYFYNGDNSGVLNIKTTNCGDTIWQRSYDYSITGTETGTVVLNLGDTNLCILGHFYDTAQQTREGFILFQDTSGVLKSRNIMDAGFKNEIVIKGYVLSDGIICGGYFNENRPDSNLFIVKTDFQGNVLWYKNFGASGPSSCILKDFDRTPDGGYIVSGNATFPSVGARLYMMKIDSIGNKQWEKSYLDTYYEGDVAVVKDGGYVLAGNSNPNTNVYRGYVAKTDVNGNIIWEKRFSGAHAPEFFRKVIELRSGDYLVAGSYVPNYSIFPKGYIARLSKDSGQVVWERKFTKYGSDSEDNIYDLMESDDGSIVATGSVWALLARFDLSLIKFDSCGYIDNDSLAAIFTVQQQQDSFTFNFTNATQNYCSATWFFGDGTGSDDDGNTSHTYTNAGVYNVTLVVRAGNSSSVYTQQVTVGTPSSISESYLQKVSIYPNPTNELLNIELGNIQADNYSITDIIGRVILVDNIVSSKQTIHIANLSKGVYFLNVTHRGKVVATSKVFKE